LTSDFDQSFSLFPSLMFNVSSPRVNERISIQASIFYLSTTYSSYTVRGTTLATRSDVIIDIKQLKIPVGVQYEFPAKKLVPYVNFGLSSTIHLSASTEWIKEVEYNKIVRTTERSAFEVESHQVGYWGGVGVKRTIYGSLQAFIEVKYEITDGIYQDAYLNSKVNNLAFLIGINF